MRKYGITIEQRDAMVASQNYKCAICETEAPGGQGWVVDHCHTTGRVRGILCVRCNFMLGYALDNVTTLSKAIKYLN